MKGDFKKAKDISVRTKLAVLERQKNKSISGVSLYGKTVEFHHVMPRGSSGVGYEWNIVAITADEHRQLTDKKEITVNGRNRYSWKEFDILCRNHLKLHYDHWSYEKCKYQKGFEEEDYGVTRNESNW